MHCIIRVFRLNFSGNPRIRSEYVHVTDVYGPGDSYEEDECGAAIMRERCSGIMINALRGSGKGLHSDIQHYCKLVFCVLIIFIQSTLVILTSIILNNRLSRRENLALL